ncbi:hypothetical protein FACS1894206_02470 [Deltaproteobacteria bacterium]|nr:hypothetical protein FACS1894206_02470 [Deltaproteobacteria bacterium]
MQALSRARIPLPAIVFSAMALLSACAVGPDYTRPQTLAPEAFKESDARREIDDTGQTVWKAADPESVDAGPWWTVFDDAALNAFMPQLTAANQDVAASRARLRQARSAAGEALGAFFPSLTAQGDVTRGRANDASPVINTYRGRLTASWELDVFGATRRDAESAIASAQSAEASLASTLLAMRAELAQDYFLLRSLDEQIRLYQQTLAAYERSLGITRNQHAAGTVTRLDVSQAETQWKNARTQLLDLCLQRKNTEHALACLLGLAPAQLTIAPAPLEATLPRVAAVIPAALLERRPDIAAAERRMAAANAQIGIAKSAYFPVISLGASQSYTGDTLHTLFSLPERIWSVGATLAQNLFQGGRLIARTEQAEAAWEASVAEYRGTVLNAFREVEDRLAEVALLEQEEEAARDALASAREAEKLALSQYRGGTVTYLNVAAAQAAALAGARNAVNTRGKRFIAAVALIRALGGGWTAAGN